MSDRFPFANGTEGEAWMDHWCTHCAHDHGMHDESYAPPMCDIMAEAVAHDDDWRWPEAWMAPPPHMDNHLPSLMVCGKFKPCDDCNGDPEADIRANVIAAVNEGWQQHRTAVSLERQTNQ